jgi:hypothetical protein
MNYLKYELYKLVKNRATLILIAIFYVLPIVMQAFFQRHNHDQIEATDWIGTQPFRLPMTILMIALITLEKTAYVRSSLLIKPFRAFISLTRLCIMVSLGIILTLSSTLILLSQLHFHVFPHFAKEFFEILLIIIPTYIFIYGLNELIGSRLWTFMTYFAYTNFFVLIINGHLHMQWERMPISSLECIENASPGCSTSHTGVFLYNMVAATFIYLLGFWRFSKRDM